MKRLLLACVLGLPLQAFAWGNFGHHVVAQIAFDKMNQQTKSAVAQILGHDGFVASATWADDIRGQSQWRKTSPYHFADLPDGVTYVDNLASLAPATQARGDVVMATLKALTILRQKNGSSADRANALKFLIHFIGDMHQPLHVGHPDDLGGNKINVSWFGRDTSLHSLWDSGLIETAHQADFAGKSDAQKIAWYSAYLERSRGGSACDTDVEAWISGTIAGRNEAYKGYDGDNAAYLAKSIPIVESQLELAGERLACAIEGAIAGAAVAGEERKFRAEIDSAVRKPFETLIDLSPSRLPHTQAQPSEVLAF